MKNKGDSVKNVKFKNLFKKLKKTNNGLRYILYLITTLYALSISFFIYSLILLDGIETLIRILIIILLIISFIVFQISGLALLISQKKKPLIIILVIMTILSGINSFAFYYIEKTYNIVDDISKEKIIYTTNLITLSDNNDEIKNIGLLTNEEDIEGHILPQEYVIQNNKKYKISYFENNIELLNALYDKKVDAIFITANYILKYSEIDRFINISNETKIIDSFSREMNNQDTVISTNKDVTQPFTILLLGVDSMYDGLSNNSAFNGDSIMLITFNPKTLSATVFSIPRDTYVPIACNNNKSYKINSAASYGTKCMIETIEQLVDIPIDYYVKINFKGVVSLVDALDGITLDIDKPDYNKNGKVDCKGMICEQNSSREWGKNTIFIEPGINQTINGEQALAYSRNRHQWVLSDFKRIEHQQAVVNAIANKSKTIRNINTLYKVLNSITNNIDTNMSTKQMLNFYNIFKNIITNSKNNNDLINIQKTVLTGYDLSLYIYGSTIYTFQYYEESLNEIIKTMKENLEIEKPELIKTFNFSVNEPYEVPTIGKTYNAVKRHETVPNFKDKNVQYIIDWTSSRNISVEKNYIESNICINDTIINQSIHSGTLVSDISNIKIDICKNIIIEQSNEDNKEETSEIDKTISDLVN